MGPVCDRSMGAPSRRSRSPRRAHPRVHAPGVRGRFRPAPAARRRPAGGEGEGRCGPGRRSCFGGPGRVAGAGSGGSARAWQFPLRAPAWSRGGGRPRTGRRARAAAQGPREGGAGSAIRGPSRTHSRRARREVVDRADGDPRRRWGGSMRRRGRDRPRAVSRAGRPGPPGAPRHRRARGRPAGPRDDFAAEVIGARSLMRPLAGPDAWAPPSRRQRGCAGRRTGTAGRQDGRRGQAPTTGTLRVGRRALAAPGGVA